MRPLYNSGPSSTGQISMGIYPTHALHLATHPSMLEPLDDNAGASSTYNPEALTPIVHDLSGEVSLYLSEDRSRALQGRAVHAYQNQSYTLRLRFEAPISGWSFDETLELSLDRPSKGYYGSHVFERRARPFAAGENLTVTLAQADWHGVTFDDWRHLHASLSNFTLCGVAQGEGAYARREKAFDDEWRG